MMRVLISILIILSLHSCIGIKQYKQLEEDIRNKEKRIAKMSYELDELKSIRKSLQDSTQKYKR